MKRPANAEEGLQALNKLVTRLDFKKAYGYGRELTKFFPHHPGVWAQFSLVANLTNHRREALDAQATGRENCGASWTDVHEGDCEREHALYCIRHDDLASAQRHWNRALKLHKKDQNRKALLCMVKGRIDYANGDHHHAVWMYQDALRLWNHMPAAQVNPQWRFNTHRWLLKALVALHGTEHGRVQEVWSELQSLMNTYGSPELKFRLQLIMRYGQRGNQADDFIESPRGQQLIHRLGVEKAARAFMKDS